MRLQLIRYESVELTEQLMQERQREADSSDSLPQTQCLQSGDDSVETELCVTSDESTKVNKRRDRETDCRLAECGENALLDLTSCASSLEVDLNREESVMRQLQDTAQMLGMEVV